MIWRAVVTGGACLLLLTACGENDSGSPTTAESDSAARSSEATGGEASSRPAAEGVYLTTVRASGKVNAVSDEALLIAGRETCGALDRGASPFDVAATGAQTAGDAGFVILGAAASTLCRQHLEAVRDFADQLGG